MHEQNFILSIAVIQEAEAPKYPLLAGLQSLPHILERERRVDTIIYLFYMMGAEVSNLFVESKSLGKRGSKSLSPYLSFTVNLISGAHRPQ